VGSLKPNDFGLFDMLGIYSSSATILAALSTTADQIADDLEMNERS